MSIEDDGREAPDEPPVPVGAPDPEYAAEILKERYAIPSRFVLELSYPELDPEHPHLKLQIDQPAESRRPKERYIIELRHLEGGPDKDRWPVTMNALDALLGALVESGYAHRDMPSGEGLEFEEALFGVEVSCVRPDLEAEADRLLAAASNGSGGVTPH